jgi:hypothetical protein
VVRVSAFIEQEIARGGGPVALYADQFEAVGSVRSFCPACPNCKGWEP